ARAAWQAAASIRSGTATTITIAKDPRRRAARQSSRLPSTASRASVRPATMPGRSAPMAVMASSPTAGTLVDRRPPAVASPPAPRLPPDADPGARRDRPRRQPRGHGGDRGRRRFLNEIIWAYDYGGRLRGRWPAKHDTILVYVRDPAEHYFDAEGVEREPSMAPGLVTPEKAARGKLPTDVWWHTIVPTSGR